MTESADLLVVDELRYAYGDRIAVKSASLTCRRGEILGLLGPNGAGKTTLLSCIAGLLQSFGGKLTFDGSRSGPRMTPRVVPVSDSCRKNWRSTAWGFVVIASFAAVRLWRRRFLGT